LEAVSPKSTGIMAAQRAKAAGVSKSFMTAVDSSTTVVSQRQQTLPEKQGWSSND